MLAFCQVNVLNEYDDDDDDDDDDDLRKFSMFSMFGHRFWSPKGEGHRLTDVGQQRDIFWRGVSFCNIWKFICCNM